MTGRKTCLGRPRGSFLYMMSGSKAPDFDAYGLFRAMHSHNPTLYSHIVGLSSHFYAHIGAGHIYLIITLLTFTLEMIKS